MKTLTTIMVMTILTQTSWANRNENLNKDTVTIEFGTKSKMVIIAETTQDLKNLQEYDVNQMIAELNAELDSAGGATNVEMLSITDSTGNKYVKDSTTSIPNSSSAPLVYYGEENMNNSSSTSTNTSTSKNYKSYRGKRTKGAFELGIGMNNWLESGAFPDESNATYAVRPWGSWYTSLGMNSRTHIGGPVVINWGVDVSWYSWKMEDANVRITKEPDMTTFVIDPTVNGSKSKLVATYLNMSLVPMLDFGAGKQKRNKYGTFNKYGQKGFRIGAGGYVGYRIDSWTKFEFQADGDNNQEKTKSNYYLNNFRYGVKGQVGFQGINLFVNYDLNTIFSTGRGPELQGISFGIIL
ncbi:MAG: hypothetical protein JXR07_06000 [Reichenbachiella sp.]